MYFKKKDVYTSNTKYGTMLEILCYQTTSATEFKAITVGNMNYQ